MSNVTAASSLVADCFPGTLLYLSSTSQELLMALNEIIGNSRSLKGPGKIACFRGEEPF